MENKRMVTEGETWWRAKSEAWDAHTHYYL